MTTVAETIVAHLKAGGVRRVYGLPGDSLNGFTDAPRRDGGIEWVHVRHEEAAAFAATADASLTGQLAVCAASCGPGNTHLVNGLYDAWRSNVPVLVIAAQIPSAEIGRRYFQETHPQQLFQECSVYCELVSTPEQLPHIVQIAMRTAISKQGVAVLVVPGDVLLAPVGSHGTVTPVVTAGNVSRPTDRELAGGRGAAQLQGARHHPCRGRLCGGARAVDGDRPAVAGADRAHVALQRARGVRQCLRCGSHRAARVRIGLPGDGEL